ncbi:Uncharacterized conserved protein [Moraxella lacunata]|uniref:Uncharacterized conserved protein n=1 Tax=Moraxella lacunata TaxID=477 RepID=A0A378T663_MORLA|nr:DUF262 domain-containing protein [Moraxella lacunata]STZ56120.1 Uncharacterized conserved protein [Moraxella lacunata]
MNSNDNIKEFTIQELFAEMDNYVIPIYQRNYAWSDDEVRQMIKDIQEYCKTNNNKRYYLGALTVKKRADNAFEVIDGQQRLTTLFLILSVLNYSFKLNLSFEHRQNSSDELNIIKKQGELNGDSQISVIYNYLQKQSFSDNFLSVLLNNVQIIRTEIPENTDLNQYFERMNNRGEQLEQHEVIKAKLMSELKDDDRAVFSAIWNACSDMSRYAVSSFSADERHELFQDNGEYFWLYENFDNLKENFQKSKKKAKKDKVQNENSYPSELGKILSTNFVLIKNDKSNQDNQYERFTSIIDFPNFLAQVLYLFLKDKNCINADIHRLDAGNLNKQFDEAGLYGNKDEIRKFTVHLLNIRLLFDRYVIKHDGLDNKDDWYIYQFRKSDKQNSSNYYANVFKAEIEDRKIKLLQTMFHYSFTAKNYKYWLFAYLKWLNDESHLQLKDCPKTGKAVILSADENIKFLEILCDKFYFNRFYQNGISKEYFDIIYNQKVLDLNLSHDDKRCAFLNTGTAVENFIFNRLDYILWHKDTTQEFRFTARNSVEHYYPQNPPNNNPRLDSIDNFGNLCLINHSQNSSLSNKMPSEKKAGYDVKRYPLLSLKQRKMFECGEWLTDEIIQKHGKEMIELLNKIISE